MGTAASKRKKQRKMTAANGDHAASSAQQQGQPTAAIVVPPSIPPAAMAAATAAPSLLPCLTAGQMQSTEEHVAGSMDAAPTPSAAASPSVAAQPQPAAVAAPAGLAAAGPSSPTTTALQGQPVGLAPFSRLADVEVQMIMQQLDRSSRLRLARCSRALFRCSSSPFAWQRLRFPVNVRGSEVSEDPRRSGSLQRFTSSHVFVGLSEDDSPGAAGPVSCATLSSIPQIAVMEFYPAPRPSMHLDEWHAFLQHPSAQRLEAVNVREQPALCDATSLSLLSQLPLLDALLLHLPAAASAAHLKPLANCPALTDVSLCGPMEALPAPLAPLAGCICLRSLTLHGLTLRVGDLSSC
jgi:hypothetical protein